MDMKMIAQILFDEMQNKKYTYDYLHEKTEIPKSSLQRYFTGESDFPLDRFVMVCETLDLDPCKVIGWEKKENTSDSKSAKIIKRLSEVPDSDRDRALEILDILLKNPRTQ